MGLGGSTVLAGTGSKKIIKEKPGEKIEWPIADNPDTPRICLGVSMEADEKVLRKIKQIGVDYVLMGGPEFPGQRKDCAA